MLLLFWCRVVRFIQYPQATLEEAVKSNDKVKVNSNTNEKYIFTQLEKNNGQYYGITKSNSKTAKMLSDQITYHDEFNNTKILLKEEQLREIFIKKRDKFLSTILTCTALSPLVFVIISVAFWNSL